MNWTSINLWAVAHATQLTLQSSKLITVSMRRIIWPGPIFLGKAAFLVVLDISEFVASPRNGPQRNLATRYDTEIDLVLKSVSRSTFLFTFSFKFCICHSLIFLFPIRITFVSPLLDFSISTIDISPSYPSDYLPWSAPNMWQTFVSVGLAASVLASAVESKGSPVLAQRATTTLTPITITGNGIFPHLNK